MGGKAIEFKCDNLYPLWDPITSWRSKEPLVMNLLRSLALLAMHFRFHLKASHIAGSRNVAADALSRNDLLLFSFPGSRSLPHPSPIHPNTGAVVLASSPRLAFQAPGGPTSALFVSGDSRFHGPLICFWPAPLLTIL